MIETSLSNTLNLQSVSDIKIQLLQIASDYVYIHGNLGNELHRVKLAHENTKVIWEINHKAENGIQYVRFENDWIIDCWVNANKAVNSFKTAKWNKRMKAYKKKQKQTTYHI